MADSFQLDDDYLDDAFDDSVHSVKPLPQITPKPDEIQTTIKKPDKAGSDDDDLDFGGLDDNYGDAGFGDGDIKAE